MKEFKLLGWPELPPSHEQVAYTRALHELSQRFVSEQELHHITGIPVNEIRALLKFLATEDLLDGRETPGSDDIASGSQKRSWWQWFKRSH